MPTYRSILVCTTNYLLPLICCNTQGKQSWIGTVCAASCQLCHTVRHGHQVQHLQHVKQRHRNEFASRPSPHINKQQGMSVALASCNSNRCNGNSNIHNGSDQDNAGLQGPGAGMSSCHVHKTRQCSQDRSLFTRQTLALKMLHNATHVHKLQGRQ